MLKLILGLCVLVTLELLQPPADDPVRADQKRLHGKWRVIAAESEGEKVPAQDLGEIVLHIAADTIEAFEEKKPAFKYGYQLKPQHDPKRINLTYLRGPKEGKVDLGIYKLHDNRLTFCIQQNEKLPRAEKFATTAGSGLSLVVLERVKE